ncbi:hypothetical protein BGI15_02465 [Snodgrassella alvi]|nr:hypothetical protein BGI07_00880 [Snodgrassella alvi]ORF31474.1 hypothetical protein BGI10_05395 [Snodgrassella alvi]ORF33064.1 hypothetical protein BGI11_09485 [Snodgrassella alvi]ORF37610.1 hypothetical protein BGI13_08160 [Snodgrassella alvi]ORF40639.1 hypothetical protein BGI14_04565 [Snodgrassella alvi]
MWVFGENHILTKVIIKRIIGASLNYSDNLKRKTNSSSFSDKILIKFNVLFFLFTLIYIILQIEQREFTICMVQNQLINLYFIFAWFYFDIKHIHL